MRYHLSPQTTGWLVASDASTPPNFEPKSRLFTQADLADVWVKTSIKDLAFTWATQEMKVEHLDELVVHDKKGSVDSWWIFNKEGYWVPKRKGACVEATVA